MKYLLDTHLLLWAAFDQHKLSKPARRLLEKLDDELFFSAASIWEVAVKSALNQASFDIDARMLKRGLSDNGYSELVITSDHAITASQLPPLHKDPFDRMLIGQAICEGITLLTVDTKVAQYDGPIKKL
jgi:PIN domain nuclease of toxin-antitoxin system